MEIALSVLESVKAEGRPVAEPAKEVMMGTTRNSTINVPRMKDRAMKGDLSLSHVNYFFSPVALLIWNEFLCELVKSITVL